MDGATLTDKASTWHCLVLAVALALPALSFTQPGMEPPGAVADAGDPCCEAGSECPATSDNGPNDSSAPDDCCPDGCMDCYLPCCGGPVLLPVARVVCGPAPAGATLVSFAHDDPPSAHPWEIFHPPRIPGAARSA